MMKKNSRVKKTLGILFTLIILTLIVFLMNKLISKESFGVEEQKVLLEGNLDKYVNYSLANQTEETLVQYTIRAGIEYGENYIPVKNSELTVNFNQIDDKFPYDVKIIAKSTKVTNGKTKELIQDYQYDANTGSLKINVSNENENGEPINQERTNKDDRDEYVIICYYDTYTEEASERDLNCNVSYKAQMFTEDNKEINGEGKLENTVMENIGDVTSINSYTDDIYNGYMKSNSINGTNYDTQYTEKQKISISKKEIQEKIVVTEENTFVNTNDIQYKSTKILKDDIINLLGENGKIEIFDGNETIIATIDNTTEFNENGEVIITYPENTNKIIIKTSNIENVGILNLENEKVIKADISNLQDTDIKSKVVVRGIREEVIEGNQEKSIENEGTESENVPEIVETETYTVETENTIEVKNAQTNVKVNLDNTQWTNKKQNEMIFNVSLDTTSAQSNLFQNPTVRIQLPSQVEKVIINNSSMVYGNGLVLEDTYVENDTNGNLNIIAKLSGKQTGYHENDLGLMTNIEISAIVILKKDIESTQDKIHLVYTNDYGNKEQGNIEKEITIEDYQEVENEENNDSNSTILNSEKDIISSITNTVQEKVATATAEEIEGLKVEVQPMRGNVTLKDGDTVYEGEYIKYNVKITNTLDKDIHNIKIVGSVPEGVTYGKLNADYYSYNGVYEYNFDENLREKEITVETLGAGKTITEFYEVKVDNLAEGEAEKQITLNIKTYIESSVVSNYEINHIVKPAVVQGFLGACLDNLRDRWNYNFTIDNPEGKEVTVKLEVPKYYELEMIVHGSDGYFLEDLGGTREGNIFIITVTEGGMYSFQGFIPSDSVRADINADKIELQAYGTLVVDGIEYKTNENRIQYEFESVSVTMTSENEGEEVQYEEAINYRIAITNTGRTNYNDKGYNTVSINVKDYLPKEVNPVTMTYEYYPIVNEETGELGTEKVKETKDISGTLTDENGNELAEVDIFLIIPYGETLYIDVETTAGYVYEDTKIENSAIVQGDKINTKTSNIITHTILAQAKQEPIQPEDPDEPTNPDNPNNPDDPNNPNTPEEQKYSISGTIWNDKNEDGTRQSDEPMINGMEIMLIDMKDSSNVKAKTTNAGGSYTFSDLDIGNYIIIFKYDTSTYSVTEYQKMGISDGLNSDAKNQTITLNGEQIDVAVTDTLNVTKNITNVDLGLVENKVCDVQVDKYISHVTVDTQKGRKEYTYDQAKLAKVEIRAKEIEGAIVTIQYEIIVTNHGEIPVTIGEIEDNIIGTLEFSQNNNANWTVEQDGKLINRAFMNQEIGAGESRQLTITFTKTMTSSDTGTYVNQAAVKQINNKKGIEDSNSQNDSSQAQVIISVSTGVIMYISITSAVGLLIVMTIFLILKYKIKLVKIGKLGAFIFVFTTVVAVQGANHFVQAHGIYPQYQYTNFDYIDWESGNSHQFTGGPDGGGGWCMNHGDEAYDGQYYVYACSDTRTPTSNQDADTSITLTKQNTTAGIKYLNGNYIVGPFQVTSSVNIGYVWEVYDLNGSAITGYGVCDENGKNILPIGDYRNVTFYIAIPADKMKSGISKVKVSQTRSGIRTVTTSYYGYLCYHYNGSTPKVPQRVKTKSEFLHDQTTSTTTITNTKSVEWTSFNANLKIIKQDADDCDVRLPNVEVNLRCDSIGYNRNFVSDENGEIYVNNLTPATYVLTENFNANYGYEASRQEEIQIYAGIVREYSLTNEKHTGNLKIEKKDPDNDNVLEGVSFIIRKRLSTEDEEALRDFVNGKGDLNANGYLEEDDLRIILRYVAKKQDLTAEQLNEADVNGDGEVDVSDMRLMIRKIQSAGYVAGMQNDESGNLTSLTTATGTVYLDNMQTTTNPNEATVFVTDKDGLIQIHNILIGSYVVEEISVGDGNFGYEVDDDYITWQANGQTGTGNNITVNVERQRSYKTVPESNIIKDDKKIIDDGSYEIETALSSSKVLDVGYAYTYNGANVNIHVRNSSIAQEFYVRYVGNGYYTIVSTSANKNLDVKNAATTPGTNVQIWQSNGSDAQKWLAVDVGNGYYSFVSKCNSLYLDVANASTADMTNVQVYTGNNSNAQKFKLNDITIGTSEEDFTTVTIHNKRKYIKIRGFAWEEKTDGKNSTKDYIWNDGTEDRRLANIPVRLINANGETIDQAYTDANGEYAFGNYDENENATKLKIEDLVGAHIEFAYNGMSYQSIAVDPNFVVNTETRENGNTIVKYAGDTNKATDEALREDFNNRYATISKDISSDTNEEKTHDIQYEYDVTNHKSTVIYGDNVQYGYEGQTYPISGVYDQYTLQAVTAESDTNALCTDLTPETIRQNAVEEIGGLNLGVEERIMPDLAVVEDMDNIEIHLNGYKHTYQYARRYDDPEEYAGGDPFNVGVKFASKYITNSYSREVYSSDVVYNHQEGGTEGKLEIYITYRLQLRNESSTVYTKLKTLANYYDERYAEVLVRDDQFVTNNEGIITEYGEVIRSEIDNSYHQNGMKKANIYTDYDIAPGKTREITITYKLGNEAVNSLLNQDLTLDSITEVTKYSSYSDDQYTVPYAGIDVDSAADTINPSDYINTTEDDTDKAPSVILTLKDERFIKGTVWEDGADPDLLNNTGYEKERRGDGIYEETTENVVKDVKVELLTVTGSGEDTEYQLAKIYQYDEENKNESVLEAETKTDEHGNYEFVGVIPSNYVLRYTYEDMSILCDKNGNILLDEEGNTKYIDADKYKSTIYRGGDKEAVENMDDYWYREETSKDEGGLPRYSDAKDNDEFMNNRLGEKLDGLDNTDITYGSIIESETTFKSVSADTRKFDMKIEYDVNKDNISKYGAELKFEFDHIDFGIIERPKQSIDVNKEVSNIQIRLTNGNDLINGDPHSQPGVRVVDDDVYIEIDNEIIQGATLIVTYGITVDNTACEIDYNTDDYYIYGIWPDNREEYYKIATVTDMFDYLPEDLVFQLDNATNEGWELVNDITDKNKYEDKVLAKQVYEKVEDLSNIIHLTDEGAETFDLEPGESATKYIVASKQLSAETDDLTYENDIEVVKLTGEAPIDSIPGNYDPTENETYDPGDPRDPEYPNGGEFMDENEPDCDDVEVTITPPTGGYKQYLLYGILGFSVLVILGVGIVIIKKKVL